MTVHSTAQPAAGLRRGRLANLKVQIKILLGFASVLVILGVVGRMTDYSSGDVARKFERCAEIVSDATIVEEIDADFLNLRRHVREYALTGDEADFRSAEEEAKKLRGLVARALGEFAKPARWRWCASSSRASPPT